MTKSIIVPAVALFAFALPTSAFAQASPAAQQMPTRAAVLQTLTAQFKGADTNGDGTLSTAEITAAETKAVQQRITALRGRAEAQFNQMDTNKDGQVSKAEFLAVLNAGIKAPTPNGAATLAALDKNKDGKVSGDEYRAPLLAQFDAVDTNKDGTISDAESQAASR